MDEQYFGSQLLPLEQLLEAVKPPPRKILLVRSAPGAMVSPLLGRLDSAFPDAGITVFCHRGREVEGYGSIIYPREGFFRADHAPLEQLAAEKFDLVVLPYATDRRDAPFYHNVDQIARGCQAGRVVIVYRDSMALEADEEFFGRKEREVVGPWLERRDNAVNEIADYTGEDPGLVLEKCEMAGIRAVSLWQETDPRTEQQVRDYYSGNDFYIYELMKTEYNDDRRLLVDAALAECEPGRSLLDYGGGVGIFSIPLALKGCRVTHLDLPGPLLDFAAWRFQRRGLEASVLPATSEEPLVDTYGIILSVFVIEHLVDPARTIAHLERHLAPGGMMLLAVDFEDRRESDELLPLHLTHLDRDQYYGQMEELGMKRLRSHAELDVFVRRDEV